MRSHTDQLQNKITFNSSPSRIISIVPSQTQFLHALGLEEEVVGITKFCLHPDEWFRNKPRVGGTKTVSIDKVKALNPDLIIGNKEENQKENIEELMEFAPVWMSDIFNLEDALEMMQKIGELVGREERANEIIDAIKIKFEQLKPASTKKKVLYTIWKEPIMVAGKNTFVDDMISRCGWENCVNTERYPEITLEDELSPDLVLLSSEPYPFKEKHFAEFQKRFPTAEIRLVDGEMFSWYGSKLLEAPEYFQGIIDSTN